MCRVFRRKREGGRGKEQNKELIRKKLLSSRSVVPNNRSSDVHGLELTEALAISCTVQDFWQAKNQIHRMKSHSFKRVLEVPVIQKLTQSYGRFPFWTTAESLQHGQLVCGCGKGLLQPLD